MKPSTYQKQVFNNFRYTPNHLLIKAGAGSGKTTTLIELLKLSNGYNLFSAFNKSIVEELEQKIPKSNRIKVKTMHGESVSLLYRYYNKKLKLSTQKTLKAFEKVALKHKISKNTKEFWKTYFEIEELYNFYRMFIPNDDVEYKKILREVLFIGVNEENYLLFKEVQIVLNKENENPDYIDFIDMIYLPVVKDVLIPKYDNLFIDECQDLNRAQHLLIDKYVKRGSRLVAVGDPNQSIYGFAGALSNSFDLFKSKPGIIELPLSICYRCPTNVIEKSNEIYDVLEPFENAIDGEVRNGDINEIVEGDFVICRNLKPLLQVYIKLLRKEIKSYVRGKDLGDNLIKFVKNYKSITITELIENIYEEYNSRILMLKMEGIKQPNLHPSIERFCDKKDCIEVLSENCNTVDELIQKIKNIFSEEKDAVILSTIHKAKGLEAKNIFLLNEFLIPSDYAKTDDQLKQEKNLRYVAYTRAKEKLIFIQI